MELNFFFFQQDIKTQNVLYQMVALAVKGLPSESEEV